MADDKMSPSPPAPTDPRLPLTAMQVFKLKKSWKGIKRCLDDTGVEMFIRFFRLNPSSKEMFPMFKDLTLDELRVDENMEKHAGKVMGVFHCCVQDIENVDMTIEIMDKTAAKHKGAAGFSPHLYMDFQQPLLEAIKITLGDRYTDNMDGIYKITIHYLLNMLVKCHRGES